MSAMQMPPELPNFAPAKMKKKERKRAACSWFSGADGSAVTLLPSWAAKGMLAVITALSATAIQYGNDQARAQNAEAKARRAAGFNGLVPARQQI